MHSSADKLLAILDLFGESQIALDAETISRELGLAQSTCYRYLKSLVERGYLVTSIGGGYALGPQIMNLEYRMRMSDPLIRIAEPVVQELAADFPGISMICRVYRELFVSVLSKISPDAAPEMMPQQQRGRALPLVRGATARIIQAHLPRHRLEKLFADHAAEFAAMGFARLEDLQSVLKSVRRTGSSVAYGEVRPGINAASAPILDRSGGIEGAITFTAPEAVMSPDRIGAIEDRVRFCARLVSRQIGSLDLSPPHLDAAQ